jgi:hypothetical protein
MRKVQQVGDEDCLAASLASLLDLPLGVVPVFRRSKDGHSQMRCTQRWLANLGYTLVEIRLTGKRAPWRVMSVPVPCIVVVKSTATYDHACVGTVSRAGISITHDPARTDMRLDKYETVAVMFLAPVAKPGTKPEDLKLLRE